MTRSIKNISNILIIALLTACMTSCKDEDMIMDTESYLRIIDDQDYNASFNPISIRETLGGGSIILAGTDAPNSDFQGISIIRLDSLGGFVGEFEMDFSYVTPVGDLMTVDSTHYFFCMEEGTLFVNLVAVDNQGRASAPVRVSGSLRYPLAAALNADNNFILLSYDPINQRSVISVIEQDGSLFISAGYSIGAGGDVEPDILDHLVNPSINYPFFVGQDANGYYFNGFYNYTLSLVFTNFGSDPTGVVQGQQTVAGIRAVRHISGSDFAVLGYQYDKNFVQPATSLSTTGISSSVDLFDRAIPEIRPNAPAKIISFTRNSGETLIIVATETEARQGILYFYDTSGGLLGTHYVGYFNPFTFADLTPTSDDGLMITGTTFVASRFERIYISKLPAQKIDEIVN